MAYSKKEKFGTKEQSLAAFAKALAHPARIAILSQLCKRRMPMRRNRRHAPVVTEYG